MPNEITAPLNGHSGLRRAAAIAATVALCIAAAGIATRMIATKHLRDETNSLAPPVVALTNAQPGNTTYTLDLPGRLQAYTSAPIYARVSGYLQRWDVDIGTRVRAGQLLAEIDAPDLDQELEQAQGNLLTARANARLATTTAIRWQQLFNTHSVSQQDLDMKNGDRAAKDAIVAAATADVHRLQVLEGFKRITAPFAGVVTARTTDVGDLIASGNSNGRALFTISDTHQLRLYVAVPQTYAPQLQPGVEARIDVPERPGKTYSAQVESSAQSVDPASGSTLVQLAVDNSGNELTAGGFANVHFKVPTPIAGVRVPASAVIVDHRGVQVATLGPDNRVELKKVQIARDLGNVIELSGGLAPTDRIIATPPDGLLQGDTVRVAGYN